MHCTHARTAHAPRTHPGPCTYAKVPFLDNGPVIELLSSKPYGLMNLLDEEVRMPQGGDDKYLAKIAERQRQSTVFAGPGQVQSIHASAFLVRLH